MTTNETTSYTGRHSIYLAAEGDRAHFSGAHAGIHIADCPHCTRSCTLCAQ